MQKRTYILACISSKRNRKEKPPSLRGGLTQNKSKDHHMFTKNLAAWQPQTIVRWVAFRLPQTRYIWIWGQKELSK